ncbi:MAG: lysozyme inhibitor LprI family protein, partial [Helicobacteraceae bacterium]|nr:lysozyme inhibitor LprI family protein [Helicobacteraceae bacterium]
MARLLTILTLSLIALSFIPQVSLAKASDGVNTQAFSPSFDCSKSKIKVEKLICASEELSRLDMELAKTYKDALNIREEQLQTEDIYDDSDIMRSLYECLLNDCNQSYKLPDSINESETQAQKEWIKRRNTCNNEDCLKNYYETRVKALNAKNTAFVNQLLGAQREAKAKYQKTNSAFRAYSVMDGNNTASIISHKPSLLTDEQYSSLLYDYAYYLTTKIGE